ncbi:MAG TPA: patatin-like phospholipase family protein [Gemmataceae bacterium]|nr:patatin-like phospholipase family protein [Gemmataceae bacterium]
MSHDHRSMFHQVLAEELAEIDKRRGVPPEDAEEPDLHDGHGDDPQAERAVQRDALNMDLTGLALSGGGIRSATFALGVLQGLASFGLLRRFDYLSTVSGGGYIGSWLAAWIKREGTLEHVEQQLQPSRVDQARGRILHPGPPLDEEPEPIHHLRAYSSYLAPKRGLFSADSWVLAATYLRNILLNQLVLLPLCVAALLLPRLLEPWFAWYGNQSWDWAFHLVMFAALIWAMMGVVRHARTTRAIALRQAVPEERLQKGIWRFQIHILAPLLLFALFMSRDLAWDLVWIKPSQVASTVGLVATPPSRLTLLPAASPAYDALARDKLAEWLHMPSVFDTSQQLYPARFSLLRGALTFALAFGIVISLLYVVLRYVVVWARSLLGPRHKLEAGARGQTGQRNWGLSGETAALGSSFAAGFTFGGLLFLAFAWLLRGVYGRPYDVALLAALGPPTVVLIFIVSIVVAVGVLGTYLDENRREWWSSLSGWLMIYALLWIVVVGVSLFGPLLVMALSDSGKMLLGSGWVASALAGIAAGKSPRTATGEGNHALELAARLAPPVFLLGLLAILALLIDATQGNVPDVEHLGAYFHNRLEVGTPLLLWTMLGSAGIAGIVALRVDVNAFSLHGLYADRLVRCYLGASRPKATASDRRPGAPSNSPPPTRHPNAITGFDPYDDIPLWKLGLRATPTNGELPYRGPYVLINTALNLTQGEELAWQERKAESFVLSPLYCGSSTTGFRRLDATDDDAVRLGTAVTLSGAAVSPNMGYHSSPAITALLTAFNVRLGGWFRNPRHGRLGNAGPPQGPLYLIKELFGRTNDRAGYVYLSDGGHFDNLGLYELVRRRCRFIVAVDGEQDAEYTFNSLGAVIRKCASDFGVRIAMDVTPIRLQGENGHSRWHCAIGAIHYADVEPSAVPGVLVYLKASLTGDEPTDVLSYAREHPPFPHQTTLNQFFTESQFESYRSLGLHVAREVFRDAMDDLDNPPDTSDLIQRRVVNKLFSNLHRRWFPPPPDFDKSIFQSVQGYLEVEQALREDENLSEFSKSLYPELAQELGANGQAHPPAAMQAAKHERAELHLMTQMVQVMENVWLSIHLEGYFAHPLNRGWMNVFRRWTLSRRFRKYWPVVRGEFSRDFVRFCEKELSLTVGPVRAERLAADGRLLGDQPAGDREPLRRVLASLREEFHWEWPDEERLETLIHRAWQGGRNAGNVWLLTVTSSDTDSAASSDPCGLIVTWQADANRRELELLVWMRGPYRDLGLGRAGVREAYRQSGAGGNRDCTLRARLPKEHATGHAYEARSAMWQSFYSYYGFRPAPPRKGEENYLILEAGPAQWREMLLEES